MAMTARRATKPLVGREKPRLAPPTPARSQLAEFTATAVELGIELFPWQKQAARYITALGQGDRWLYPEVCTVVARQNGKTRLLVPLVISRLRAGHKITHAAQTRELTRELFGEIADIMSHDLTLFPKRYGRPILPRFGAGQEEIRLANGGSYRIVAATRAGARGQSNDLVIIDELREFKDFDFIGAAKPTLNASRHPQMVYLSNAGETDSIVLNAARLRADSDPALAYLEWSAAPERAADDIEGWREANPAISHIPNLLETLEREYATNRTQGTLAIFETEYLCRSVITMREKLVDEFAWARSFEPDLEQARRPTMAVSMSPDGKRATCAIAWLRDDLTVGLRVLINGTGNPIDTALLGKDLKATATRLGIKQIGFDPLTDKELAKYFAKPTPISGGLFANASAQFVNLVNADHIRWNDADAVTDDLTWTSRKPDAETGSYQAVRAQDDRSITASLAAIRAVWLASGPKPVTPKVMT
jgi:hypothetical protein